MSERTQTRSLRAPRRVRAYLAANGGRPSLLLATSEEAAERYAREAAVFTDGPVVHLPSRGVPYGDVFDPAVTRVGRRQRALRSLRSARVVVAGPLAFMERTPLYEPLELAAGTEIELDATLERLVALGYERVDRVSRPGEFAVRGGIVDVFPSTRRSPVRVEWWGDEIESVRAVSLATQRVVRELEAVTVYAAREGDLAGLAATDEDIPEEARRGVRVPGLDRLLLDLNPVSPRRLLPEDVEVWREEPQEDVREEVDGLVRGLYDRDLPEPDVEFSLGEEGEAVSAPPVVAFSDTLREAARRLDSLVEDGLAVFVACSSRGEARRTVYAFGEINRRMREAERVDASLPPGLYAVPGEVEEGFTYPDGGLAVFRRDSLLGRRREARRRSGGRSVASFADLKVGDLVVHAMQGIGRFEGLVAQEVLGATRDYMQVSYRGGDTLFVPYEQMELLHKYVGGEGARLDKLGGATWAQVTDRVRKRVKALAGELLRLHAQRASAPGFAFPEDGEWERELEEGFPYQETPDQEAAITAVKTDMQRPHPMDRLVCGDVGFGKTEVSVRAAFKAALAGKQTMMLAPTTILVQQHERTFRESLGSYAVRVESLSRFTTPRTGSSILADFPSGEVDVLIGTHALLGSEIRPKDLGLVVVDEEQRFGVRHKERIKEYKSFRGRAHADGDPDPTHHADGPRLAARHKRHRDAPRRTPQHPHARRPLRGGPRKAGHRAGGRPRRADLLRPQPRREHRRGRGEAAASSCPASGSSRRTARCRSGRSKASCGTSSTGGPTCSSRRPSSRAGSTWRRRTPSSWTAPTRWGWPSSTSCGAGSGAPREQAYAYLFAPLGATVESQKRLEALMDFTELGSGFAIAMRDLEIRGAGNLLGAEQSGHIAAVGFEMYLSLLEEAVARRQGRAAGAASRSGPSSWSSRSTPTCRPST